MGLPQGRLDLCIQDLLLEDIQSGGRLRQDMLLSSGSHVRLKVREWLQDECTSLFRVVVVGGDAFDRSIGSGSLGKSFLGRSLRIYERG